MRYKTIHMFLHARFASLILDNSCVQSFPPCEFVLLDLMNYVKVLCTQEKIPHCRIWGFLNVKNTWCKGPESGLQTRGHHCQGSAPRLLQMAFSSVFFWVTPLGAPRASVVEREWETDPKGKFAELCATCAVFLSNVRSVKKLSHYRKVAKIFCKIWLISVWNDLHPYPLHPTTA